MHKSIVYQYIEQSPPKKHSELNIKFELNDCLAVAQAMNTQTKQPVCVLNMANQFNVGGDYLSGGGQEESIILRTNLLDSLIAIEGVKPGNACNPYKYELDNCLGFSDENRKGFGEFTTIYSPDVQIFSLDKNNPSKKALATINILTSAAYNLTETNKSLTRPFYMAGTIFKIMNQLRTAKKHSQRHLVLGAFGCGAFQNPPEIIAQIYHAAIHEFEFKGCFDSIVFAIKPDAFEAANTKSSAFNLVFSDPPKRIYDLMCEEGVFSVEHPLLDEMRKPYSTVDTTNEFYFLASRIINKEINYLIKLPKNNSRFLFLQRLIALLDATPSASRFLIEAALESPECKTFVSSSKIFKGAKYRFVMQLERLLEQHTVFIPGFNPTQISLVEEFVPGYLQRNTRQLIESCADVYDKKVICYLLYLAIFKGNETLEAELVNRLMAKESALAREFLLALNEICLGISQHRIVSSIADVRFQSDLSIQYDTWYTQTAENLSNYIGKYLDAFLMINYPDIYDKKEFESVLKHNIYFTQTAKV